MDKKPRKTRTKNFTSEELSALVGEVEKARSVLYGPLRAPTVTQHHRDRAWENVREAVNAVSPVTRSVPELRKKFKELKCRTKQKVGNMRRESRKTGGGDNKPVPLNNIEQRILAFIAPLSWSQTPGLLVDESPSPLLTSPPLSQPASLSTSSTCSIPSSRPVRIIKKKSNTLGQDEISETTELQQRTNELLEELLLEFREFNQLKMREIELKEEELELKRRSDV